MTLKLADGVASAMADAVTAKADAGAGAATLKVYTGTQPATPATAASGTLLATFTLADPSIAAAAAGVSTFDFSPAVTATVAADGTAGWFRIADSDGNAVLDGAVSTSGSQMNASNTSWTSGGLVSLNSGTFTQPTQ